MQSNSTAFPPTSKLATSGRPPMNGQGYGSPNEVDLFNTAHWQTRLMDRSPARRDSDGWRCGLQQLWSCNGDSLVRGRAGQRVPAWGSADNAGRARRFRFAFVEGHFTHGSGR